MEPLSSTAAPTPTCNGKKRKNRSAPAAHENAKRLKTVHAGPGPEALECSPRSPSVSVPAERVQQPITVNELSELLHYAALGRTAGFEQPSWCRLVHEKKIKALNVVVVDGLTESHFYEHYLAMQHLRTKYTTRITFTPSSADLLSGVFSCEVPECYSKPHSREHNENGQLNKALRTHPVIVRFGTKRRGLTAYVLSQEEMIRKHFPVKEERFSEDYLAQMESSSGEGGMPGFEEFVCTDSVGCVTDSSPLYGLDCEMCLTEKGMELARVSLVDGEGKCLLDSLVRPENRILDYLTRFSGITAVMLQPIKTTLRDVQAKLRSLLPSDAVLVGHSLNNDLVSLKLIHRHVIDTSLLFRREFGQKFKLKVLAETVLKREIQSAEKVGHDPTEDAAAALELAQYFIKIGPRQVVERHMEELWGYTIVEEEPADRCVPKPAPVPSRRFADVLRTLGRSVAFVGRRSDLALDLSSQHWHCSDKEVLRSFKGLAKLPFLSAIRFSSFRDRLKKSLPHQEQQNQTRVCESLRNMCVVFAGPFPSGFSEKRVKRLFRCCGPLRTVRMLSSTVRVHAELEFELLEGAVLALKVLNGLNVQGQPIKVQRPVSESMLDLDVTLDALMTDNPDSSLLYAVKLNPRKTKCAAVPKRKVNGHATDTECPTTAESVKEGVQQSTTSTPAQTEETMRETFGRFGAVERVFLPDKPGKRATHAYIKFRSSEGKHAALGHSEDLWEEKYLVCPPVTPPHLVSWVSMATAVNTTDSDTQTAVDGDVASQEPQVHLVQRKLDRRLQKLFTYLPECTLSVVVLPGHNSAHGLLPGLCFLEVKEEDAP